MTISSLVTLKSTALDWLADQAITDDQMDTMVQLAERRIFPAFDIERSGTRAEEKLLDAETLAKVYTLRRMIDAMGGGYEAILPIIERLSRTRNNHEFLETLTKR